MMAATCFKYVINIPRIIMGMQLIGIGIGKVTHNFRLEYRYTFQYSTMMQCNNLN